MKNQPPVRKPETLEDIVFEGRNKSYGAFNLNLKRRKYLIVAFLISFTGFSTAIAVPFILYLKGDYSHVKVDNPTSVEMTPLDHYKDVPPPPKPPVIEGIEQLSANLAPIVVVDPEADLPPMITNADLLDSPLNKPVDTFESVPFIQDKAIDEPYEEPVFFPQEAASFMGGDVSDFRNWVIENIKYPQDAAEAQIFGKVYIEFCVNKYGEVVEVRILRKLHPSIDEEAIRVISKSPRWNPAKQGGNPVKQRFVIPFSFEVI